MGKGREGGREGEGRGGRGGKGRQRDVVRIKQRINGRVSSIEGG